MPPRKKTETKDERIARELVSIRRKVKDADGDTYVEGLVSREALEYLLDAHDAIPDVLEGIGKDFDQVVVSLREAAALLRRGRPR